MSFDRPMSSQSRAAWDDEMMPAVTSDNETFVAGGVSIGGQEVAPRSKGRVALEEPKAPLTPLQKVAKGIRSLWATRMTEDTENNRELYVKTTLRELIVYLIYLASFSILALGMTSTTMFYYTNVLSQLFLDSSSSSGGTFRGITNMNDFWGFVEPDGPLLNGLYWETWYNGMPVEESGFIYYENKLLGVPRLRQLKVHDHSCEVASDFEKEITECYDAYAEQLEDKEEVKDHMKPTNLTGWVYQTEKELKGSSHQGQVSKYGGGGYVQNLALSKKESAEIIETLKFDRWVRRGTRVIFIDFTVYNANVNLFCIIRLTVEFPPTGGAISSWSFRTVKAAESELLRYVSTMDYLIMGFEFIFILFVIYYCIEEAIEIRMHRMRYFKSFWNVLDVLVLVVCWICIVFNVYRQFKVNEVLEELLSDPEKFADFEFLSYWQMQFNNAVAIGLFFSWAKVFKYISFNKTMTQLSSTLAKCAKDLAGFAVMFFIIFFAFAQLGYLIFGTQIRDFSTFWNAVFTLFRIILGDFNFNELENAHRVLGPAYFILYVFFVFFVLLNMFLAIINDTYSEVKEDLSEQENEFEMGDYFKQGYQKMMEKMNFKKERIVDIQSALQSADMNGDKMVDFEEWRRDLRNRGYAEEEIEAVFAKYDVDGDRVLDDAEQRKMMLDLEGQKQQLQKDLDDSGDRPISSASFGDEEDDGRPTSARSRRRGKSSNVNNEEFNVLSRRVDRMEHSIGSIVSKIDAVLVKLESDKKKRSKGLDRISEGGDDSRQQMESMVREELQKWDAPDSRQQSARSGVSTAAVNFEKY